MDSANSVNTTVDRPAQLACNLESGAPVQALKKGRIWIEVDVAAAFDILSVLEVKEKNTESLVWRQVISDMHVFWNVLGDQLGEEREKIYHSPEYKHLLDTNLVLFTTINEIKAGKEMTAEELDALNFKRFKAKKALQEKFYGKLNEVKIGYAS